MEEGIKKWWQVALEDSETPKPKFEINNKKNDSATQIPQSKSWKIAHWRRCTHNAPVNDHN